jgi:hypothetical protein
VKEDKKSKEGKEKGQDENIGKNDKNQTIKMNILQYGSTHHLQYGSNASIPHCLSHKILISSR